MKEGTAAAADIYSTVFTRTASCLLLFHIHETGEEERFFYLLFNCLKMCDFQY